MSYKNLDSDTVPTSYTTCKLDGGYYFVIRYFIAMCRAEYNVVHSAGRKVVGVFEGGTSIDHFTRAQGVGNQTAHYFFGVSQGVMQSANIIFGSGVYGARSTCSYITSILPGSKGWLAASTGWCGYSACTAWTREQSLMTKICNGDLSIDPDTASSDPGWF